jgi:hypothetical protein
MKKQLFLHLATLSSSIKECKSAAMQLLLLLDVKEGEV